MTNVTTFRDGLRGMLRLEGLLELAVALALYAHISGNWVAFAVLFLAPDLAMFGYLAGPRLGAISYNATHSYVGPAVAALLGLAAAPALLAPALIWAAHIAFDRMLGYGLKSRGGFGLTHLGPVGRTRA
jgi:hypothetical protein